MKSLEATDKIFDIIDNNITTSSNSNNNISNISTTSNNITSNKNKNKNNISTTSTTTNTVATTTTTTNNNTIDSIKNNIDNNNNNNTSSYSVSVTNLSYTYPSRNNVQILNNIYFNIQNQQFIVFIGKSGAGKSTLCKLLCGLYKPTVGNIYIGDTSICDMDPITLLSHVIYHIFIMHEKFNISYIFIIDIDIYNIIYYIYEYIIYYIYIFIIYEKFNISYIFMVNIYHIFIYLHF